MIFPTCTIWSWRNVEQCRREWSGGSKQCSMFETNLHESRPLGEQTNWARLPELPLSEESSSEREQPVSCALNLEFGLCVASEVRRSCVVGAEGPTERGSVRGQWSKRWRSLLRSFADLASNSKQGERARE